MKYSLIIVAYSPSPSALFTSRVHSSTKPKIKPRPSRFTPSKSPLSSSPPSSSASTPRNPLLSTVRWDSPANCLKYYADLATKLAEDGRFQDFIMIVEIVVVSGVKPAQFVSMLNVKHVSDGIKRIIKEGKVRSLVEVTLIGAQRLGIDPLKLFDESAKQTLAQECARILRCGEAEEIVHLMEILAGFQFSVKDIVEPSDIIKVCVKKRIPNVAVRYALILPHSQIIFCNMVLDFGKKGDLVSALTIFEASKQNSDGPNMYAYRAMIDVCGLCDEFLKSRSIYEELISQNVTPNTYVFNSLMNVNAHDLSYTLHVYKKMQKLGVIADVASYNIILKSCCLAARVDVAQDIYREVQHLELVGALKLDVFTYSTMIKVFADAKLWQMALQIKEDMLLAGVTANTVAWSSLLNACANAGLVEHAIQLFEEMLLAGCEPNSQCYNILLHACVEACQYDRAFRLFQSWKDRGFQNACKDYHGKTHSNSAEQTHKRCTASLPNSKSNLHCFSLNMKAPFKPTTTTYNILMKACGTDYYRAKALMDEMKSVGLSPNQISWSILINVCGGSGNVEGAMQILKFMQDAGVQPDAVAYTTAIKVCVKSKNLKLAYSLFGEMKRYQIQPNLVTYNTLLRARSKYGSLQEVQQCLAIYQDMRKAGYKSNEYYLKQLIEEWCEGVIQNENQNQDQPRSCNRTDLAGPHSLLLEKVAEHLQESNAGNLVIDLQGLTKVEARIVVLAVLRMVKETFAAGDLIKDEMLIILGVEEIGATTVKCECGIKDAIIKLLQDDLGLEVILASSGVEVAQKIILENHPNFEEILGTGLLKQLESPARRPAILPRLKVTRDSLCCWLQKRSAAIR